MKKLVSLFAGIGGFDLAAKWTGAIESVAICEIDAFCRHHLQRHWPNALIWEDVHATTEFLAEHGFGPGYFDILTAGFPCQGNSQAGKRLGRDDARYLWPATADALRATQPRWFVGENVGGLLSINVDRSTGDSGIFGDVVRDLAEMGYAVTWGVLQAADAGAPHLRERVFIIAHRDPAAITWVSVALAHATQHGWFARGNACAGLIGSFFTEWRGQPLADAERQQRTGGAQLQARRDEVSSGQQLWDDADRCHKSTIVGDTRSILVRMGADQPAVVGEAPTTARESGKSTLCDAATYPSDTTLVDTRRTGHQQRRVRSGTATQSKICHDGATNSDAPLADTPSVGQRGRTDRQGYLADGDASRWTQGAGEPQSTSDAHLADAQSAECQCAGDSWTGRSGSSDRRELAHPDFQGLEVGDWRAATRGPRFALVERGAGQTQPSLGGLSDGVSCRLAQRHHSASAIAHGRRLSNNQAVSVSGVPLQSASALLSMPPLPQLWTDGAYRWPSGPGEEQWDFEPPRTITGTLPHRAAQLKAFGNSIVPQLAYVIMLIIITWDDAHEEASV